MKKKFILDKINKVALADKKKYCTDFIKNLDSFNYNECNKRDLNKLSIGSFYIEEHSDDESLIVVC